MREMAVVRTKFLERKSDVFPGPWSRFCSAIMIVA